MCCVRSVYSLHKGNFDALLPIAELFYETKLHCLFECNTGKRLILCSFLYKSQTEGSG